MLKPTKWKANPMTLNVTVPGSLILKEWTGNGRGEHAALVSSAPGAGTQQQLAGQPSLSASPAVMCADLKPERHIPINTSVFSVTAFTLVSSPFLAQDVRGMFLFKLRGLTEISAARSCTETMRRGEEDLGITTAWFTAFHYGGEVQQTHLHPHRGGAFLDGRLPVCVPGGQQHLLLHKWREGALHAALIGIWVSLHRPGAGRRRPLQNHI